MFSNRLPQVSGLCLVGLLVLVSCSMPKTPEPAANQPQPVSSSVPKSATGTTEDFTNEATPKNPDSLEVSHSGTGNVITETLSGSMIITGTPSAAGTLRIFSDYDCLYCRQFIIEDLPWIENIYLSTGKLKLERIIFPLTPAGDFMSRAALCEAEKGKFRQIDRLLSASPASDETRLLPVLKALKLSAKSFHECLTSLSIQKLTASSVDFASTAGVSRVPTFVLGKKTWTGVLPQEELKQTIDDYLRR